MPDLRLLLLKFWEMQELIFANQSTLDDEHDRAWAQQLGLDVAQWEKGVIDQERRKR